MLSARTKGARTECESQSPGDPPDGRRGEPLSLGADLQGIFLGLLIAPLVIYVAVAVWRWTLGRTVPPDVRAAQAASASRFLALATVLVGMAWLLAVMDPVHSRQGAAKSYADLLAVWWQRLPFVALGSAIAGFLASVLGTSNPVALAFWLGMPTGMYAGLAWAAYTLVSGWVPAGDAAARAEFDLYVRPLMTIVTAFPVAAFAAGLLGAVVGTYGRTPATSSRTR